LPLMPRLRFSGVIPPRLLVPTWHGRLYLRRTLSSGIKTEHCFDVRRNA